MVYKNSILFLLILLTSYVVFAQDENFFLDTSGSNPQIFQRLSWQGDNYALNYEIIIERAEATEFAEIYRETIEESYVLVSLHPGRYRFRVIPYNLLGQPGESSEWNNFSVTLAHLPSLEKFFPNVFYLEFSENRIIDVAGRNFVPESIFYLSMGDTILEPVEFRIRNSRRATLFFEDENLIPGNYNINVVNPGGFNASLGELFIGYRKPLDINLKTGWSPIVPVYGNIHKEFGTDFFWPGATFSLEAISSRRGPYNGGVEFLFSIHGINPVLSVNIGYDAWEEAFKNADSAVILADFILNLVFQKRFLMGQTAVTARIGGGLTYLEDFTINSDFNFTVQAGLSYFCFIHDIFFIEPGLDLSMLYADNLNFFLKPRFVVGWRL